MSREKEIINRAEWLYAFNGGGMSKQDCARQSVWEQSKADLIKEIGIFELTDKDLNCYADYIAKCF